MLQKTLLWVESNVQKDKDYATYVRKIETRYPPFEVLDYNDKHLLYKTLALDPTERPEAKEMLAFPWLNAVECCELEKQEFAHPHNC